MHRIIYANIVDSWDMVICTIYKSHLKYLSLKDCWLNYSYCRFSMTHLQWIKESWRKFVSNGLHFF